LLAVKAALYELLKYQIRYQNESDPAQVGKEWDAVYLFGGTCTTGVMSMCSGSTVIVGRQSNSRLRGLSKAR